MFKNSYEAPKAPSYLAGHHDRNDQKDEIAAKEGELKTNAPNPKEDETHNTDTNTNMFSTSINSSICSSNIHSHMDATLSSGKVTSLLFS